MPQYSSTIPPIEYGIRFEKNFESGFRICVSLVNAENHYIDNIDENWDLFERKAREYKKVVFVYIGYEKYIICPELLINNYNEFGYSHIYFEDTEVPCDANSKLYELCKSSIRHKQPFVYYHNQN
jgi:hypothetical protein